MEFLRLTPINTALVTSTQDDVMFRSLPSLCSCQSLRVPVYPIITPLGCHIRSLLSNSGFTQKPVGPEQNSGAGYLESLADHQDQDPNGQMAP